MSQVYFDLGRSIILLINSLVIYNLGQSDFSGVGNQKDINRKRSNHFLMKHLNFNPIINFFNEKLHIVILSTHSFFENEVKAK